MAERFLEQRDTLDDKSFVRRRYGYSVVFLFFVMAVSWAVLTGVTAIPGYSTGAYFVLSVAVFTALTTIVFFFVRNDREIMHSLEFQNALFAAAAKHSCDFYAILRHDGRVVYIHPDFYREYKRVNASASDNIDALCQVINIESDKQDLMMRLMREGKKGSFRSSMTFPGSFRQLSMMLRPISMFTGEERHKDINLVLEPISRPSGFFLLMAQKDDPAQAFVDNLQKLGLGYFLADKEGQLLNASPAVNELALEAAKETSEASPKLEDIFNDFRQDSLQTAAHMPVGQVCTLKIPKEGQKATERYLTLYAKIDKSVYKADYIGVILKYGSYAHDIPFELDKLTESEILTESPVPAAVLAIDGNVLYYNKAFDRLITTTFTTGNHLVETEPGNFYDLIHPDERENVKRYLERAAETGNLIAPVLTETATQSKDQANSILLYVQALKNSGGNTSASLAVYIAEAKSGKRLDEYVAHSQKMQAVGQLAGGIAHDFNNLLTAMLGFCDLLLARHPAGDESFSDVMQIRQNANRAAGLVKQLLAFSRRQTLRPKVVDITDTLADLSDLLARLLGENVQLCIRHGRNLCHIRVDIGQLEQVIVNLAVNARDAMSGYGSLTISSANEEVDERHHAHRLFSPEGDVMLPGKYVCITISDTGEGIPKENLEKIFEPFFSTKQVGAGTGLGLATVYGIIKQTNGYVYVDTEPKKGTKFLIYFPEAIEDPKEQTTPVAPIEIEEPKDVTGKGVVLLVEDEAPVRMFSASALKSKGYDVLEAENAFRALDIMEEQGEDIDVIVTDVVMPGMSGPSFIEKVQEKFPEIKVIFVSGYSEDQFMEHFQDARSVDFLPKPYNLKQLAGKVKSITG